MNGVTGPATLVEVEHIYRPEPGLILIAYDSRNLPFRPDRIKFRYAWISLDNEVAYAFCEGPAVLTNGDEAARGLRRRGELDTGRVRPWAHVNPMPNEVRMLWRLFLASIPGGVR